MRKQCFVYVYYRQKRSTFLIFPTKTQYICKL